MSIASIVKLGFGSSPKLATLGYSSFTAKPERTSTVPVNGVNRHVSGGVNRHVKVAGINRYARERR